ncbi:hypothetical protein FIM10_11835 [Sphingomonadales bacterium 56]|uniref:hypothetical protein n=1 Tax=Sphingobium sp. S6 TaxID=2758386 RepID=UPI00191868C5|nr:hypothetical protein [Sphingobium sp. S6]MBY2929365.1 hypothetical protein [Sphingomonadales bacterium 56]CAD7339310.1 hypothetical protein SPHS6_02390 [Sphingobium sp. S6]
MKNVTSRIEPDTSVDGALKTFDRSLPAKFREQLVAAAESGWWRDVLDDEQLLIALRGSYLNVYWKGQSIFKVEAGASAPKATTHEKYLLDPKLSRQVRFDGMTFDTDQLKKKAFLSEYGEGSLSRMKRAAELYSGEEKTGCHWVALANPTVIDVEVAFPGAVEKGESGEEVTAPRIDLLALEASGEDQARLVFWEAKAFKNPELGSAQSKLSAPVLAQIAAYRSILETFRLDVERSYTQLCRDICAIREAAGTKLHPLIHDVAEGRRTITLGETPQVNLLVFGFDGSQKDHPRWKTHKKALTESLAAQGSRLRAVGDPKGAKL